MNRDTDIQSARIVLTRRDGSTQAINLLVDEYDSIRFVTDAAVPGFTEVNLQPDAWRRITLAPRSKSGRLVGSVERQFAEPV